MANEIETLPELQEFPIVDEQSARFIELINYDSESDEFPVQMHRLPHERMSDYIYFLMYAYLGQKRSIIRALNTVRAAKELPAIPSDIKTQLNKQKAVEAGFNSIPRDYVQLCVTAKNNEWTKRVVYWDSYISKRMLQALGNSIIEGAINSVEVLIREQNESKKSAVRVSAAKALLQHAVPRTINHNITGEITVTDMHDTDLARIAQQIQISRPNFPAIPTVVPKQLDAPLTENVPIEADYSYSTGPINLEELNDRNNT